MSNREPYQDQPPPKEGDLRMWWCPRAGTETVLHISVRDVEEGARLLNTVAMYDDLLLKMGLRQDTSTCGGLEVFRAGDWESWSDAESGEDDPIAYVIARAGADSSDSDDTAALVARWYADPHFYGVVCQHWHVLEDAGVRVTHGPACFSPRSVGQDLIESFVRRRSDKFSVTPVWGRGVSALSRMCV